MQRVLMLSISAAVLTWAASAGVSVLGQTGASAAETKEFYGTGFRNPGNMTTEQDVLSDCGDTDKSTNVVVNTLMGPVAYTGIIQGNGTLLNKQLVNTCAAAAAHANAIVRDTFQSVTVNGRTGGAVIEIIAHAFNPAPNVLFNDNIIRTLCGTGDLKGIHAEGTVTSTQVTGGVNIRPFQLLGDYDPPGQANEFDFLCSDLPNH